MRYRVGQTIPVIRIGYESNRLYGPYTAFRPWCDRLVFVEVAFLKVMTHAKVPGTFSDTPEHDGYQCEERDAFGRSVMWNNQFPRAIYGQTTDDWNWRFENLEWLIQKLIQFNGAKIPYPEDAAIHLGRLTNGIAELSENKNPSPEETTAVAALRRHLVYMTKKLEHAGCKIRPSSIDWMAAFGYVEVLPPT